MVRDGICGVLVDALRIAVAFSNLSHVLSVPSLAQIGHGTHQLEIFSIGRFWLVRLVGQKMVVCISDLF